MNVSAQDDSYITRQVAGADYIGSETEGEVARTTGRALDALVETQHSHVGTERVATRSRE
jgi:hypothetical protein